MQLSIRLVDNGLQLQLATVVPVLFTMNSMMRVLVMHPIDTDSILLVCLRSPLKWNNVINEIHQAITDTDELPHQDAYQSCKLMLHPTKSRTEEGVMIRKKQLDRSIRDGDLLSVTGLCINSDIKLGAHSNLQDPLSVGGIQENELLCPIEFKKERQSMKHAFNSVNTIPSTDTVFQAKKRNRSISSKFWLIEKLAASGVISLEQKDSLKLLLLTSDSSKLLSAFETYEATGDVTTLLSLDTRIKRTPSSSSGPFSSQFQSITKNLEAELDLIPRTAECDRIHRHSDTPTFDLDDDELDALVEEIMEINPSRCD